MAIYDIENDEWNFSNIIWDREPILEPIDIHTPIDTISNIRARPTISIGTTKEAVSAIPFLN